MREVRFNGNRIELFDSIEALPVTRYMQFNRFLLIDSGIGSDLEAIDGHISIIRVYLSKEDIKNADKELLNMRQAYSFVLENLSPKALAFTAMIKTLNGKKVNIESDEDAQKILKKLSKKGLTYEKLRGAVDAVKKKIDIELETFFPKQADSAKVKTYYEGLKKSTMLLLDKIQGKDTNEEIEKINDFLFSLNQPRLFWGSTGVEVNFIKGFEKTCAVINQHIAKDPKGMTVLSFYQTLEILKEQFKSNKK